MILRGEIPGSQREKSRISRRIPNLRGEIIISERKRLIPHGYNSELSYGKRAIPQGENSFFTGRISRLISNYHRSLVAFGRSDSFYKLHIQRQLKHYLNHFPYEKNALPLFFVHNRSVDEL